MENIRNPRKSGRKQKGLYKIKIEGEIQYKKFTYKGKYAVYGLASTRDENKIEYIGYTSLGVNIRYNLHVSLRNGITPKEEWVRDVLASGQKLILIILKDGIKTKADACNKEIQLIKKYGAQHMLKNSTLGGLGKLGYVTKPETKHKQSISTLGIPKGKRADKAIKAH